MPYCSYHNRIRQRIDVGEYIGYRYGEKVGVGSVLWLMFDLPPFERFVRPHSYWRYEDVLKGEQV